MEHKAGILLFLMASPVALVIKNPPANAGNSRDAGSTPGLGRSPDEGHGNPLQSTCLENPMDIGAWWATVHGVAKSWTCLSTHKQVIWLKTCSHKSESKN